MHVARSVPALSVSQGDRFSDFELPSFCNYADSDVAGASNPDSIGRRFSRPGESCASRSQRLELAKQPSKLKYLSSGKPLNPKLPMLWDTQLTLRIDAK
jgi:hypothetical protein